MNEACLNAKWIRQDLTHKEAQDFTAEVLNHMRERLSDYQEKYGDLYNLEATPAESTAYRLARHDRKRFPDIITAAKCDDTPYYTNSSHLPVSYTDDIFSALDIQDKLQTLYTSGTVFHSFLGEKLPDWKSAANLVRKIADNYRLPYYTMSPTYSICRAHGYLSGEQKTCPHCGEKTEVYSRITGYYRPVQNWNDGKTQDFKDRKVYDLGKIAKNTATIGQEERCCFNPMDPASAAAAGISATVTAAPANGKMMLFTTSTCPNCKVAKHFLDQAGLNYEVVVSDQEPEKAREFGISHAPTLIVGNQRFENVSDIRKFIETAR